MKRVTKHRFLRVAKIIRKALILMHNSVPFHVQRYPLAVFKFAQYAL